MKSVVPSAPTRQTQNRYWWSGMDSYTVPDQLTANEYVCGVNIVNRGGLPQTRPGTRSRYCLPEGARQGFTIFTPSSGVAHHCVAIGGKVYFSYDPFKKWYQMAGVQFNANSKVVTFCSTIKSVEITDEGEPVPLPETRNVLIMQDGRTRAAYWDGAQSGHLNPTELEGEATDEDHDNTKIGLHMAFSGQRLWVARKNKLFASDLGNAIKFTESEYLNELPFFPLSGDCTGMVELPDKSGLLVFTETDCTFVRTSIQDRTQWSSTADFFSTILNIGCVAPRSIVTAHGLIYWFSPAGLISLNDALRANQTSELIPLDQEMAFSKAYIGPILADIACVSFENYLLVSVPYCSLENTHTWAMDLATFEGNQRSWNGVWTGWRPVQWCTAVVQGRQRCFFLSHDFDDNTRVWEAFQGDRTDNGCAIMCSFQTRLDPCGSAERKRYRHAEIDCVQVYGDVSIMVAVAGWRGWFDRIMTKEIVATHGRIDTDDTYGDGTTFPKMGGNRPQVRTIRTQNWETPSDCNECGVESENQNNIDTEFQLFIAWSGRLGIRAIRQYAVEDPNPREGACEPHESGFRTLMDTGCGSLTEYPDEEVFPAFTATRSAEQLHIPNIAARIAAQATAASQISQANADKLALCHAEGQIFHLVDRGEPLEDISIPGSVSLPWAITIVSPVARLSVFLDDGTTLVTSLSFSALLGALLSGQTQTVNLIIKNTGSATLTFDLFALFGDQFEGFEIETEPGLTELEPGETSPLIVRAVVI